MVGIILHAATDIVKLIYKQFLGVRRNRCSYLKQRRPLLLALFLQMAERNYDLTHTPCTCPAG